MSSVQTPPRANKLRPAPKSARRAGRLTWPLVVAVLTLVGLGVALYLSYTSLVHEVPVCAGIGDCSTVQSSPYARVLGVPVSYLGLASYISFALLFLGRLRLPDDYGYLALLGMVVVGVSGTVFSAYLTYVEFFVIDALCPWCIVSATTLLALLGLAVFDLRRQMRRLPGPVRSS